MSQSLPEFHLEQTILRGDKSLGEKQVVLILGVDVRHSPAVAQYVNGTMQTGQLGFPVDNGERGVGLRLEGGVGQELGAWRRHLQRTVRDVSCAP